MWSTRLSSRGRLLEDVCVAQVILPLQRLQRANIICRHSSSPALHQTLERWRKNGARLYARRIIEIAAASAALRVNRVHMQEAIYDTPTQWVDWEQKDWTDALLNSLGGNPLQRFWMAGEKYAVFNSVRMY